MSQEKSTLFFYALTSMHAGSGSSLEVIDMPIQREKHTDFPIIQSSSVKGSLRRFYSDENNEDIIFGKQNDNEFASAVVFTDARVLFFPVKSFKKVFVWITCPFVLKRFQQDVGLDFEIPDISNDESAIVTDSNLLIHDNKLVLDEYVFKAEKKEIDIPINFSNKEDILSKLVVVSDEMYKFFVQTGTEVVARTKINSETGVVSKGALWYEENLPPETLFYSMVFTVDSRNNAELKADEIMKKLKENIPSSIQVGGNETIGKGLVELDWVK